jgi:hypothetical protein
LARAGTFAKEGNLELQGRFHTSALLVRFCLQDGMDATRANMGKLRATVKM